MTHENVHDGHNSGPHPQEDLDDELTAYHEAGHAVAMWKLGFGISVVSIAPAPRLLGYAESARDYAADHHNDNVGFRRFIIEQHALFLHAGDVASRLLRPGVGTGQASTDHRDLHQLMYEVEDDGSIQIAWCNYLWQRAYTLIAWPGQWYLVFGLAHQLLSNGLWTAPPQSVTCVSPLTNCSSIRGCQMQSSSGR